MLKIEKFSCNLYQENCYVVSDETGECLIIDCGAFGAEEIDAIESYIRGNNLTPVQNLLTHAHMDHIFGVRYVYDRYGLKPVLNSKDMQLYETFQEQTRQLYGGVEIDYTMPAETVNVNDGDIISFGNHKLKVISTPGHSAGSVFYYCEDEKVVFSGDTLFRGGIGRTDLPGGSMFQIIQSLRMITQLPDDVEVYPGHGLSTTIGYELATNMYLDR